MAAVPVYQVDVFTQSRFKGNPAGVVPHADGLTDEQMQGISRELNNPETAFVLKPTSGDHDVWVRFFTPTTEVTSCGHATIAAHYVRALENNLDSCVVRQRIGTGVQHVNIIRNTSVMTLFCFIAVIVRSYAALRDNVNVSSLR